eukprot:gene23527-29751_t
MWLSPLRTILRARERRDIGDINSLPFAFIVLNCTVFAVHPQSQSRNAFQKLVVGTCVMIFNVLYYAAPLSTLVKVIQLKDSSSILSSMVIVNLLNAVTWLVYGVALSDPNIIVPHCIGMALACLQIVILVVFHKPRTALIDDIELNTVYHVDQAHSSGKNKLNGSGSGGKESSGSSGGSGGDSVYSVYFAKYVGDEGDNSNYHDIILL